MSLQQYSIDPIPAQPADNSKSIKQPNQIRMAAPLGLTNCAVPFPGALPQAIGIAGPLARKQRFTSEMPAAASSLRTPLRHFRSRLRSLPAGLHSLLHSVRVPISGYWPDRLRARRKPR